MHSGKIDQWEMLEGTLDKRQIDIIRLAEDFYKNFQKILVCYI